MKREELIKKIERQRGYIDAVDAFAVVSIFTDLYGVKYYDNLTIEEELIVMWDKIKNYKEKTSYIVSDNDLLTCPCCKETKEAKHFYKARDRKNGRKSECSKCSVIYQRQWKEKKKLKNEITTN